MLADISTQSVDEILCLGDVVGYGPNPLECVDLIMQRCRLTLKGNHDEALVHGAYAFNLRAQKAICSTSSGASTHPVGLDGSANTSNFAPRIAWANRSMANRS